MQTACSFCVLKIAASLQNSPCTSRGNCFIILSIQQRFLVHRKVVLNGIQYVSPVFCLLILVCSTCSKFVSSSLMMKVKLNK